jgi:sec-independent protein translocase protein TatA
MAPSIWQILIIILIVLLLFGAGRLPRIMEDMAKGIKSFKKGMKDEDEQSSKAALSHSDDDVIDAETADTKKSTTKKK